MIDLFLIEDIWELGGAGAFKIPEVASAAKDFCFADNAIYCSVYNTFGKFGYPVHSITRT